MSKTLDLNNPAVDFSLLIGGKAGFGIDKSGTVIARVLSQLGLRIYIYRDYPSLIRGGHTFSIIRCSKQIIGTHTNKVDIILALNQDTFNLHKDRLKDDALVIYDSDIVKVGDLNPRFKAIALAITNIVKTEGALEIMRNTCIIGAFAKVSGIKWETLEEVIKKEFRKETELNLKIARRGYDEVAEVDKILEVSQKPLPLLSGNQAVALGLVKGGLKTFIAYPMTPSSPVLHFLAEMADEFALKVIHPESEIGVILMALGFSYMGEKVAVGTAGGGFCLMTEGLSFSGMAELPVVIIVGQRPGPSTGLPTYSSQTDLHFVLNAGQGEFLRFLVAPGDLEEAYFWSAQAMNISCKFQIPSLIFTDKDFGEGVFSFDLDSVSAVKGESPQLWDRNQPYKRYLNTESGVSPLAFPADKEAIVKVSSYEHDEYGITTEDPKLTVLMQDKRLRKTKFLEEDLEKLETVKVYGNKNSSLALLCWGSNKRVCVEAGEKLGLRIIQPLVMSPFPKKQMAKALNGVKKIFCVENNATGQLERLLKMYDFDVDGKILKYDGRPFSLDELEEKVKGIIK